MVERQELSFSGSGPGARTNDGCSVELYRRLPYTGELEFLATGNPAGSSVLELGCGTGRLTRRLLAWGCDVTAVDDSAEMLSHLPAGAHAKQSSIEALRLGRHFDVVLLASCLINHPQLDVRKAFLQTAAQHLQPGGALLLERHDEQWLATAKAGDIGRIGDVLIRTEAVSRRDGLVHVAIAYESGDAIWRQRFCVEPLDEPTLGAALHDAGFDDPIWIGPKRRWAKAVLAARID